MKTTQPVWELVSNLGDANPVEHGGLYVWEDTTGVYPPEIELLEQPCYEEEDYGEDNGWKPSARWTVRRGVCEPCTYTEDEEGNWVLSDNKFHPRKPAWFADSARSIAESCGMDVSEFRRMLCFGTVLERAQAWRMIADYHGWDNLDSYPRELTYLEAVKFAAERK